MKKTNAIRLLDQQNINYQLLEYTYNPNNLDVAKIARDNELPLHSIYKTLVTKGDKTGPVVAVLPGDASLDLKKLAKASGNKKIALLKQEELEPLTGYIRGGCSPLGMKKLLPIFFEALAESEELIYVNGGKRGLLFGAKPIEIARACKGVFVEIVKD